MLRFKINDQYVDLPEDFSFTMNLKSPIFGDVGSYSYPFKLPASARNKVILGFPNRMENTNDTFKNFDAEIEWNGITIFKGTANLKSTGESGFEGSVYDGSGDLYYKIKGMSLQNIDFSGDYSFATEQAKLDWINIHTNRFYPEVEVGFPQILNKSYFDEMPVDPFLQYFNHYHNDNIQLTSSAVNTVIVPMLFLRYILKKIFEAFGFIFDDQFFATDPDYNSLALFNLVDCNSNGVGPGFFNYDERKVMLNYHLPRTTLNDFFAGLEKFFNIRFFVDQKTNTVFLKSVGSILRSQSYKEFLNPPISIGAEQESVISGFHLKMDIDTDDEYFTTRKQLDDEKLNHIRPPVKSISDLPPWPSDDMYDIRYVHDVHAFYILWTQKQWTLWSETSLDLYLEYIYRNDDQLIETIFSTLLNYNITDDGVIGNKRSDWKKCTPKLFFVKYNGAESGARMAALPAIEGKSLFFGGQNGIFRQHYKDYFDFRLSTKLVKIQSQLSFNDLKDFDFSSKYYIKGRKYLIRDVQVTLKRDRILPALISAYICD